ncbi:hypothetical protein NQ314_006019 [Rhamnusium bicolor]|uniref:HTH CENPB-type domain-containing protein n=1 Tax=Rhamnusium bicolor TaxID=1586634 RepID=A0AAV8Z932_9CUCU|nr:hypothetical protein NQ314_006019 [Rhamnusium bicolor]
MMESVPGSSIKLESDTEENSAYSEESKQHLTDAIISCEELLLENKFITSASSSAISSEIILKEEELYHDTVEILDEKQFLITEELILFHEHDEEDGFTNISEDESQDEYEPEQKRKKEMEYIPLDYKIKVVNLAKQYPKWGLRSLQRKGCSRLKNMTDLKRWEKDIKCGGTTIDKYAIIDSWTYNRFVEARQADQQVTSRNLQHWALAGAAQFKNFEFKASNSWVKRFKRKYKIRQRKITKYVTQSETAWVEEILLSAEKFRLQTRELMSLYDNDFVIKSVQTECQYHSPFGRSLAEQGAKTVLVKKQNLNKMTHLYTAHYSLTLSGKLLPNVFVCLQEPTDNFEPRLQTSSCIAPYVQKTKFLLLINPVEAQTNPPLYDDMVQDETCTIKVIPPKCMPWIQPCDAYFYEQVKNFIKRLRNSSYLIENRREISSQEDCIKIHSIVHHQLSSPIFSKMWRYACSCDGSEVTAEKPKLGRPFPKWCLGKAWIYGNF